MKSTTIFRLYEEGKLDLDKPVSEYVKSWPKKHPPISVRQIASHTSGIRHYKENPDSDDTSDHDTKYPEFYSNVPYKEIEDALEVFKDDDLLSEPGNAISIILDIFKKYTLILYTFFSRKRIQLHNPWFHTTVSCDRICIWRKVYKTHQETI